MKAELRDLPLWALHSDLSQFQRRLEIIDQKARNGIKHKRGLRYELRLKRRIEQLKKEIARRSRKETTKGIKRREVEPFTVAHSLSRNSLRKTA